MTLPPAARTALLIGHIAVSVGWMGAAAAYIVLNVPALAGEDEQASAGAQRDEAARTHAPRMADAAAQTWCRLNVTRQTSSRWTDAVLARGCR